MDRETQANLDAIREFEIVQGFRIKELPKALQALLKAYDAPVFDRVRFSKLNPGRKKRIGELVQRCYHRDLRDDALLSHKELKDLAEKRGEWSDAEDKRMEELRTTLQREIEEVYLEGTIDTNWREAYLEEADKFAGYVTEAYQAEDPDKLARVLKVFDRWAEYLPEQKALYTERYAAEQERPEYSADQDLGWLYDHAPHQAAIECLNEIEDIRERMLKSVEFGRKRWEWGALQERYTAVFSESIESRRSNTEAMAKVYHCVERVDANDKAAGPLTATFDELWELPEDVIQWLLVHTANFLAGRTDADLEYLEALGFLHADRKNEQTSSVEGSESAPSDASPDPQTSKRDLTPSMATGPASSE
jgi:hypothetical protein